MKFAAILLPFLTLALAAPVQVEKDGIVDFMEVQSSSESTIVKADQLAHDLKSDEDLTTLPSTTVTNLNNHTWTCIDNIPCYVSSKTCVEDCEAGLMIALTGEKQTEFEIYMNGPRIDKGSVLAMEYKNAGKTHKFNCIPAQKRVHDKDIKSEKELQFINGRETSHSISCKFTAHVFHNFSNTGDDYTIQLGNIEGGSWKLVADVQVQKEQSFVGGRFGNFEADKDVVEIVQRAEKEIMEDFRVSGTQEAQGTDFLITKFEKELGDLQSKKTMAKSNMDKKKVDEERVKKINSEKEEEFDAEKEKEVVAEKEKEVDADKEEEVDADKEEEVDADKEKEVDADKEKEVDADKETVRDTEVDENAEVEEKAPAEAAKNMTVVIERKSASVRNSDVESKKTVAKKKTIIVDEDRDSNEPMMRSSDGEDEEEDEDEDEEVTKIKEKNYKHKQREIFESLLPKGAASGDSVFMAPDSASLTAMIGPFFIALLVLMF